MRYDSVETGDSQSVHTPRTFAGHISPRIRVPAQVLEDAGKRLSRIVGESDVLVIRGLASAVDRKEPCSRGHSSRVSDLAAALAEFMRLDESQIRTIRTSAALHDVGKIIVPTAILAKPDSLDERERSIMMVHPEVGAAIVERSVELRDVVPGVISHHERWDGAGYPGRLALEQIPLAARIVAIADTYDAITSDRPYRPAKPHEFALDEIALHAGRQFDPNLVHLFFLMMARRARSPLSSRLRVSAG